MTFDRLAIALTTAGIVFAQAASATTIVGGVTVRGHAQSGAVVYLDGQVAAPSVQPPPRLVMDQKDLAFVPGTLPVVRGTIVEFRNSDDVEHNVFSPSEVAKRFDLGTYRRGESRSVVFDRVGEVLVLCNIHMEMAASILVLRDPYFARTDSAGRYRIEGVPPGTYTLRVWRDEWSPHAQTVEVTHEGSLTVDVSLP